MEPFLQPVHTIGYQPKIIPADCLLRAVENGMIGRDELQHPSRQRLLQCLSVTSVTYWRTHHGSCSDGEVLVPHYALVKRETGSDRLANDALSSLPSAGDLQDRPLQDQGQ
jgi:hypothetical protein